MTDDFIHSYAPSVPFDILSSASPEPVSDVFFDPYADPSMLHQSFVRRHLPLTLVKY